MAQTIDLSAGLVPVGGGAAGAGGAVGGASGIDLSAGLVPASAPTPSSLTANPNSEYTYRMLLNPSSPYSPVLPVPFSKVQQAKQNGYQLHPDDEDRYNRDQANTTPGWGDALVANLTRPTPSNAGVTGLAASFVRHGLGAAATLALHPIDTITGAATQMMDAGRAADAYLQGYKTPEDIDKAEADMRAHPEKFGTPTSVIFQQNLDTLEQYRRGLANTTKTLYDMKQKLTTDPAGFLGEQIGQLALTHETGLGAENAAETGAEAAKKAALSAGRKATATGPHDMADQVRKAGMNNAAIEQETAQTNQAALQAALAKAHMNNAAIEQEAAQTNQAALAKAHADEADAQQALSDLDATDAQRNALQQQQYEQQAQIRQVVPQIRRQGKAVVDKEYADVREAVNQTKAQQDGIAQDVYGRDYDELGQDEKNAVDAQVKYKTKALTPVARAVSKVSSKLSNPAHAAKIASIVEDAQNAMPDLNEDGEHGDFDNNFEADRLAKQTPVENGQGNYSDFASMPEGPAKEAIRQKVLKLQDDYINSRLQDDPDDPQIDFDHAHRLSSRLGKEAYKASDRELQAALLDVKKVVDEKILAPMTAEAGVGGLFKKARQHYASLIDTFDEPSGPSDSGSPVAQSKLAEDDFNAAKPFLPETDPAKQGPNGPEARARKMLVGDANGATPHYAPEAGELVDRFRETTRQLRSLPDAGDTAKASAKAQARLEEAQARKQVLTQPGVWGTGQEQGQAQAGAAGAEAASVSAQSTPDATSPDSASNPLSTASRVLYSEDRPNADALRAANAATIRQAEDLKTRIAEAEKDKQDADYVRSQVARPKAERDAADAKWDEAVATQQDALRRLRQLYSDNADAVNPEVGQLREDASGRKTLWLSKDAMDMLHYVTTKSVREALSTVMRGARVSADNIPAVITRIAQKIPDPSGAPTRFTARFSPIKQQVINLLTEAAKGAGPEGVTIVGAMGHGIAQTVKTAREEMAHAWQGAISKDGNMENHLSFQDINDLNASIPESVHGFLNRRGYEGGVAHVVETAAKIIAGDADRIGFESTGQAREWLEQYFDAVVKEHGKNALSSLLHVKGVARKIKETYEQQQRGQVQQAAAAAAGGGGGENSQPLPERPASEDVLSGVPAGREGGDRQASGGNEAEAPAVVGGEGGGGKGEKEPTPPPPPVQPPAAPAEPPSSTQPPAPGRPSSTTFKPARPEDNPAYRNPTTFKPARPEDNPKYQQFTPESVANQNEDAAREFAARMRRVRDWNINGVISGVTGMAISLAELGNHPLGATWGLIGSGTTLAVSLARQFVGEALSNDAVIQALRKPTIEQYRQIMALPANQRPGVAQAMEALEREAQARKLVSSARSPWRNFNRSVVLAGAAAGQTEKEKEKRQQEQQEQQEQQGGLGKAKVVSSAQSAMAGAGVQQ